MNVELIRVNGSDLDVVNAARVSFNKESSVINDTKLSFNNESDCYLNDKDLKLIKYLAKHKHTAPFNHVGASFRIKAPIFVARQLAKHQIGLAWNEVSRRYVKDSPDFYIPFSWRMAAENVKQGSSKEEITYIHSKEIKRKYYDLLGEVELLYNMMIEVGVCPEQARMVLPQSMMTEWIWTGSLTAFARVCALRLDPHTQKETFEIAESIGHYLYEKFPDTFPYLYKSMDESYNHKETENE